MGKTDGILNGLGGSVAELRTNATGACDGLAPANRHRLTPLGGTRPESAAEATKASGQRKKKKKQNEMSRVNHQPRRARIFLRIFSGSTADHTSNGSRFFLFLS